MYPEGRAQTYGEMCHISRLLSQMNQRKGQLLIFEHAVSSAVRVTDCRFRLEPSAINNQKGIELQRSIHRRAYENGNVTFFRKLSDCPSHCLSRENFPKAPDEVAVFEHDSPGSQAGEKLLRSSHSLPWTSLLYSSKRPKCPIKGDYLRSC
jgi:hypothetical protein